MPGFGERMLQGADDQAAHDPGIAEPDLGLGRVDVDVDLGRRDLQKQGEQRVPVGCQEFPVGTPDGAQQQAVAHGPAVDEQELHGRVAAVQGRHPGMAGKPDALAQGVDGHGVVGEGAAHDAGQAFQPRRRRIVVQARRDGVQLDQVARAVGQGEGDFRMGHGQAVEGFDHMVLFRARGLEEL